MSQPIDEVYVELHARGERDAARDIKRAVDDIERDVDKATRAISQDVDKAFDDMARSVEARLKESTAAVEKETATQDREWKNLSRSIGDSVADGVDAAVDAVRNLGDEVDQELQRTEKNSRRTGKQIGDALGEAVGPGLFADLARVGAQLRGISALLPSPLLAGLAAAVPAVIALGGALVQLLGLLYALPAAVAVFASIGAAVKVGFSGIGEAVKALKTGDVDKIAEAMKGLAPSARVFAQELFAIQKPLAAIKRTVQEVLVRPLKGDLPRLVKSLGPTLTHGLAEVARGIGTFLSDILELLGDADIKDVIGDVFASTARIVKNLSPQIVSFIGTIFGVIEHALPFVERGFAAIGRGLELLSGFLSGKLKTGEFESALESAFSTMKDLGDLAVALTKLLGALFGNAGDEGQSLIRSLTEMTNKMTEFLNSAEGQEALQQLLDSLPLLISSLSAGLTILGAFIVLQSSFFKALGAVGGALATAGKAVGDFFVMLWNWITSTGPAIGGFFASIGSFFVMLWGKIVEAWNGIVSFFGGVVSWFAALPGRIWAAIQALPGLIAQVFTAAFDRATYIIGFAIGSMVKFAASLPGRIWSAIVGLVSVIGSVLTSAWNTAVRIVQSLTSSVVMFFIQLPGRVRGAVSAVVGVISGVFNSARSAATGAVSRLVSSVISFIASIPGRARSALSGFVPAVTGALRAAIGGAADIGRAIMSAIANAISGGVGFVIDAARRVARNIMDGFKDALGIGSPSKVARDEVGRQITAGVALGVRAEVPELRQLLSSLVGTVAGAVGAPAVAAASGQIITFDAGAVQVTFAGAVPTPEEALATGRAVGEGIAQAMARRNTRIAVRTA